MRPSPSPPATHEAVATVLAVGVALVLLIPSARGMHPALGWLPLWLVGMPAAAACAVWRAGRAARPAPRAPGGMRRRRAATARTAMAVRVASRRMAERVAPAVPRVLRG